MSSLWQFDSDSKDRQSDNDPREFESDFVGMMTWKSKPSQKRRTSQRMQNWIKLTFCPSSRRKDSSSVRSDDIESDQ
jgi:hypothetical protein